MKPITWLSNTKDAVRSFSEDARSEAGHQLGRVQLGKQPEDWKPMPSIGIGVNEVRVHAENEYRVIYVAKFSEAIYVLHSFSKKTRQTSKRDIELAKQRYRELLSMRREK